MTVRNSEGYALETVEALNARKEQARQQFDEMTDKLGIKHTFTFDEAWDFALAQRYRQGIVEFESALRNHPKTLPQHEIDTVNPLKHSFADGCYIREVTNPANELIVTKIHKTMHPFFLLEGDMSILTERGPKRIHAPYYGITKAGTKRVIYTHSKCVFVTVHVTKERDLAKIEDEVIAKDFDEIPLDNQEELLRLLKEA